MAVSSSRRIRMLAPPASTKASLEKNPTTPIKMKTHAVTPMGESRSGLKVRLATIHEVMGTAQIVKTSSVEP